MESQVSPKNIETRVEAMNAASAEKPIETPAAEVPKVEAPKVEAPKDEAPKVDAPTVEASKVEVKPVVPVEKKQPNDPTELRKWSTKLSQENAALRDDMKTIKAALDKLTKKPVDYAELAKNPDSLKAHIEAERQEAVKELQEKLVATTNEAVKNETIIAKLEFERDAENYPRWNKLFPLIQNLAGNQDGRVNFNRPPREVLHDLYALAETLSPAEVAAVAPAAVEGPKSVVPAVTEEQIQARITAAVEAAVAKAAADSAAGIRAEQNGAGLGSAGKGRRRDSGVSKDALQTMPLKELKKMISKE